MQKKFFILVNGEQQGPFSVDQLKGYLAMGQYQITDLAWHEGAPDWKPLGDYAEFPQRAHRTPNYDAMRGRQAAALQRAQGKRKSKAAGIVKAIVTVLLLAGAGVGGYYGYNYWKTHHGSGAAASGGAAASTASP